MLCVSHKYGFKVDLIRSIEGKWWLDLMHLNNVRPWKSFWYSHQAIDLGAVRTVDAERARRAYFLMVLRERQAGHHV